MSFCQRGDVIVKTRDFDYVFGGRSGRESGRRPVKCGLARLKCRPGGLREEGPDDGTYL
jgi:hypothetical protein